MLTSTQSYVTYQGNGAATSFPYSFPVADATYLQVSITNNNVDPPPTTVLTSSQYAVTGIGNGIAGAANPTPGGCVTYPTSGSPLPNGWSITIQRIVPYTQGTSLANQGGLWPVVVEGALDYLTMLTQQLAFADSQLAGSLQTSIADIVAPSADIIPPFTLPANGSTISLAGLKSVYLTANTQATTITGFCDMTPGHRFQIIVADNYTVISFATWWSGLPSGSIIGHQGQMVDFAEGDVLNCVTDGTFVYTIDSEPMVPAILPLPAKFSITNVSGSNTAINVNASSITLPNIAGLKLFQTWASQIDQQPLSFTASGTTLGAGGLDTGSLAASTWYYIWLIGDGTNIYALLSKGMFWTFVNKTYVYPYTYARLVGCALTDANANFINFHQFGNDFLFDAPQALILAAEASYTECTTNLLPPIAVKAFFRSYFMSSSGLATFLFSADGATDYHIMYSQSGDMGGGTQFELPLLTSSSFWYKNSNISGTPSVNVRGFMLNL